MEIRIDEQAGSKIAVISSDKPVIEDVNDALDVMADARYNGCDKLLIRKEQITESFFDLKTKLAGEILQKYTNYSMKIAIVGDFGGYNSKSLKDFIYECNQGNNVLFLSSEAEALERLHQAK